MKDLTSHISNEIPKRAKKVLLEYKLDNISQEIYRLVKEHKRIKEQLNYMDTDTKIDDRISKYIQDEINFQKGKNGNNITNIIIYKY